MYDFHFNTQDAHGYNEEKRCSINFSVTTIKLRIISNNWLVNFNDKF